MRERRVWSDALLTRPWILVLAVALFVALPVLVLGQASEHETRARLKAAHVASAAHAASTVVSDLGDRIRQVSATLRLLALNPTAETSLMATAVRAEDNVTLQSLTDAVYQPNVTGVLRTYIAVRGHEPSIVDARIVAVSPPEPDLVGRRLSELPGARGRAVGIVVGAGAAATPGGISPIYEGNTSAASGVALAAGIRFGPGATLSGSQGASDALATIIAEIDLSRLFAAAARAALTEADDAYLIDATGRLAARARGPVELPLRDLSADPFVQLASANDSVARADQADPIGNGPRLLASAYTQFTGTSTGGGQGARVVLARDTSVIDRETDAVLSQLAAARYVLVAVLLVGAYLLALAIARVGRSSADRERLRLARDLHDLLGRSLAVIAIKSQLAKRLAPAGDIGRAVEEIGDVERIARESLQDVRQAVDGYRQPGVEAELAGARSALAAAGIACTVEHSVGPLDPSIDTALAWAVREGVTNVIRHGRATTCDIRLTRSNGDARLEIINDGPRAFATVTGNGLRGLHERAADRGGSADARPLPDGGFRLSVRFPLRST